MANWFICYRALPDGKIQKREASRTDYSVTVRKPDGPKRGETTRYTTYLFDLVFGTTPDEAVSKALAIANERLKNARAEVKEAEDIVAKLEARQKELIKDGD